MCDKLRKFGLGSHYLVTTRLKKTAKSMQISVGYQTCCYPIVYVTLLCLIYNIISSRRLVTTEDTETRAGARATASKSSTQV